MTAIRIWKMLVLTLVVVAFAFAASTFAAVTVSQNIASTGSIVASANIGLYSDSACTKAVTSISWGSLSPGGSSTQTVYVKNTGASSVTLSLVVSGWNPTLASSYLTLSWNRQNTVVAAGQSVAAALTLTVSSSITSVTSFSNTITISGTG